MISEQGRKNNAAAQRKWAAAHPETVKAMNRKKYLARRSELLDRQAMYAHQNKDKIKSYQRSYAASPEGKIVRNNAEHRRRAKIRASDDCATNDQVKTLLMSAANCEYCRCSFDQITKPTLDHVIPLSRGGSHKLENLTAACAPCNLKKGAKLDFQKDFT